MPSRVLSLLRRRQRRCLHPQVNLALTGHLKPHTVTPESPRRGAHIYATGEINCEQNLRLHRHIGPPALPGRGPGGKRRWEPGCFGAAACCSHCRIRIPPEFGKQRHAACTPATPALTQTADLKPPHARQLASRRQLKFPSEWRLLSTLLKHARGLQSN